VTTVPLIQRIAGTLFEQVVTNGLDQLIVAMLLLELRKTVAPIPVCV
jgi:hypothetical protein